MHRTVARQGPFPTWCCVLGWATGSRVSFDGAIADELTKLLNEAHVAVKAQRKRDVDGFRRALLELEPGENRLFDLLTAGTLDDAAFKKQLQRIRDQRTELTRKLDEANDRLDDAYLETARTTLELAKRAKLQWSSRSALEKRQFLEVVVSNVRLDGRTVRYDLRKPFQILSELREDPTWRTREDSNLRPSDS